MTVALFSHPDCELHRMPKGHPECPERTAAILEHLETTGLRRKLQSQVPVPVDREVLEHVHHPRYVRMLYECDAARQPTRIDADTMVCPGTLNAARLAAGAAEQAVTMVLEGKVSRAFCAVRPPGHHAEYDAAMGFCYFNNVAVGARTALRNPEIQRVAILDFDVHHGNGTVDIFQESPEVLVCSSFQHPFYPNRHHDTLRNNLVHTPLPAGTTGAAFQDAIERDWLPAIERHKPDLVLVSAGFDAHADDPLGQMLLTEDDFRWITDLIVGTANKHAGGRIVSTLEGGYNLEALARSAAAHIEGLMA
jgi:acetoin utilization deacetylase AcuC-like enzyme